MISEKVLKSLRIQAYAEGKSVVGAGGTIQSSVEILRINMLIEGEEFTIEGLHGEISNHKDTVARLQARAAGYQQVLAERNK